MKATLVKRTGEHRKLSLVFSWQYLLLGPLYYAYYGFIFKFLILSMLYVFCVWRDAGSMMVDLLTSWGVEERFVSFLEFPGNHYFITLGIIIGIHILLCFVTPKMVVRKLVHRKGFVPYSETDAQLLVKHSLAKVGTKCYLTNNKPIDGVQGKIKIENTKNLDTILEELAQLLKDGMITKDEYNTKRAEALMNKTDKK